MLKQLWTEARSLPRDNRTLRRFGLAVGGVFGAIALFLLWRSGWTAGTAVWVLLVLAAPLLLFGAVAPGALRGVYPVWMMMALLLGTVMTRVLLTLVFFGVVTPVALVMRLAGKDPMHRRPDAGLETYWITREPDSNDPARMEKLY